MFFAEKPLLSAQVIQSPIHIEDSLNWIIYTSNSFTLE
ncbi:MAG: hypothetical protein OFPII_38250 [Osedax symbiont Rs1]|nr:MAG: hypothetical protein OFPII_38250 [Osedax symbiont Rs1]